MKVFTFLGLAILAAGAASAQPVRDVLDAQEAARAHQRDIQPALDQIREMAALLNAFANVQRDLSDATQPNIAIDKAQADLADYAAEASRRGAFLDRESRATIESTRRLLEAARNGSAFGNFTDLRERIHHNTIHPLQRRALQMNRQVDTLVRTYEQLAAALRTAQTLSMSSLERFAMDPEKP